MSESHLNLLRRIAFIGGGNMAEALVSGLTRRGLPGGQIVVADPIVDALHRLQAQYGIRPATDNVAAAREAQVVMLAVKPQFLRAVALQIAPHLEDGALVISIAAGIPYPSLVRWMGAGRAVIRTMPNRPAFNGCGATALYAPADVGMEHRALAQAIMNAVGTTVWVPHESQLDTVTALSGSGPAYFFLLMEALEAAAHARGLPADVAHELTLQTALGAAQMARQACEPLARLREQVTSKGGTTAAALTVFDAAGLRDIVAAALTAADERSAELAAQFAAP
jgi:pyrroline-5-carboxylate reductase